MSQTVAILGRADLLAPSQLKRASLLFDHICMDSPLVDPLPDLAARVEWLHSQGILVKYPTPMELGKAQMLAKWERARSQLLELAEMRLQSESLRLEFEREFDHNRRDEPLVAPCSPKDVGLDVVGSITVRYLQARIEQELNCQAILFGDVVRLLDPLPVDPSIRELIDRLAIKIIDWEKREKVARVVIKAFPLPSEASPWEQIIDFRNDPDSTSKYLKLKVWMNRTASEDRSQGDIEDELRELIYEYTQHMKLHRMRWQTGNLEFLVTTASEVLEHLIRFQFGRAAKAAFDFKQREISLREAELSVPGREVALIVKANEVFGPQL